jgi:hypothetical protein
MSLKKQIKAWTRNEATESQELLTARAQLKQLEVALKRERSARELLEQTLDRLRSSSVKLNLTRKAKSSKGGVTLRVIVPDSHGCFVDQSAASAMLADIAMLKPSSIILLGDHLDCGGFLAEHHTWGYVAETDYTFEDDCAATNQFLDALQSAAPQATIEYLEGNHERRIEKWIVTDALRTGKGSRGDVKMLNALFSTETVLQLDRRKIPIYKQGQWYDGCHVPGTILRDNCYFTHGQFTSKAAAAAHLAKYNSNIWFGHTHRMDMATKRTVASGPIGAWNPGCLCQLQPFWMHQNLTDWVNGYGIQLVQKGLGHLNLQIPIIDGVSYLSPLIRRGAA